MLRETLRIASARRSNSAHLTTLLHRTLPHVGTYKCMGWKFLTLPNVWTSIHDNRMGSMYTTATHQKEPRVSGYHEFLFAVHETRDVKTVQPTIARFELSRACS